LCVLVLCFRLWSWISVLHFKVDMWIDMGSGHECRNLSRHFCRSNFWFRLLGLGFRLFISLSEHVSESRKTHLAVNSEMSDRGMLTGRCDGLGVRVASLTFLCVFFVLTTRQFLYKLFLTWYGISAICLDFLWLIRSQGAWYYCPLIFLHVFLHGGDLSLWFLWLRCLRVMAECRFFFLAVSYTW
jgi:hypothetical protein